MILDPKGGHKAAMIASNEGGDVVTSRLHWN